MDGYNPQQQWQGSSALNHTLPEPSPQASQLSAGSLGEKPLSWMPARVPRVPMACERCRAAKSKCSGDRPCHDCQTNSEICVYRPAPRAPPRAAATALDEYTNTLKKVQRDFKDYKSWIEKGLQEVKENNKRTVQELTTRIELIIGHFMEHKDSSEQRIQKLEEANAWALQQSSNQANATLQWIGDIGKRVDDLERKAGALEEEAFQRWREQWSLDEGIQPTAHPFLRH